MNKIPIIGWIISLIFNISMAVPFWIVWTLCGIGRKFFNFIPENYQSVGFWETVGIFTVIGILKSLLTPRFVNINQTNER
jgi:hypothetical protein